MSLAYPPKVLNKKLKSLVGRKTRKQENKKTTKQGERLMKKDRLDSLTLFEMMKLVADIVFAYVSTKPTGGRGVWLEDRRESDCNPFYDQTASGIFLEMYYGQPSALWTPWGKYSFGGSGSGSWGAILPEILQRLGATVHRAQLVNHMGTYGPVYAINSVDGVPLEEPKELPRERYATHEEVEAALKRMKERLVSRRRRCRSAFSI